MCKNIWLYPFGLYGLAFIVNQKWINKIYKQGKVDGTIPICLLQLDRGTKKNENETEICIEKDGF